MSSKQSSADHRVHLRLTAKDGALAFHRGEYGRIIDVSPEGLSFLFEARCKERAIGEGKALRPVCETLDIASCDDDFILVDMPVAAIADIPLSDPRRPGVQLCRRCIRFGDLLPQQVAAIEKFLRINRLSAVSAGQRREGDWPGGEGGAGQ